MNAIKLQKAELAKISPERLSRYLEAQGWKIFLYGDNYFSPRVASPENVTENF